MTVQERSYVTVLPSQIEANDNTNSRRYSITAASVKAMAQSLLEHGQLEPVKVVQHPDPDSQYDYRLVYGFRRHKAAELLNTNGTTFYLTAEVVEDDGNGFIQNVIENTQRRELSIVDQAYAMNRLVNEFGKTQREVADICGCSPATVNLRLKLLQAPANILRSIHDGKISADAVLEALSYPEDSRERKRAMDALTDSGGVSRSSVVRRAQEEREEERGTAPDGDYESAESPEVEDKPQSKPAKRRTTKQMAAELEAYADVDAEEHTPGQVVAAAILRYVNGGSFARLKKVLCSIPSLE